MQWLGNVDLNKRTLGNSIGKDLGEALTSIAHHKTAQIANKEKSKLWESLGVDKDQAASLMRQPEAIQKAFFDRWQSPEQQEQQVSSQLQPREQPSFSPEQQNVLRSIPNPENRQQVAQQMIAQNRGTANIGNEESPGMQGQQQQGVQTPKKGFLRTPGQLTQNEKLAAYKDMLKEKAELRKIEYQDVKESKAWFKENNKKVHGLKEINLRLDRMKKLVEQGKLTNPVVAAALDTLAHGIWGLGINLKGLQNSDSQEFEKLSSDMFKGIGDIFGSRILKTEVDQFAKTIPTLLQSDAGKLAVIDNLKMLGEAKIKEDQIAKQIIKANNGQIPANLQDLVQDQLEDYLDDLHDRFVNKMRETPPLDKTNSLRTSLAKQAFKQGLTGAL